MAAAGSQATASRQWLGPWPVVGISVVVVALDLCLFSRTLEDAFMTFRYSEHLADGYGLGAWNVAGERVEGYSSLWWMLLLALARTCGANVATAAKLLGLGSHLALTLLFLCFPRLAKRELFATAQVTRDALTIGGVIVAFYLPIAWYAMSGMEASWFALMVGLCLLGPLVWRGSAFSAVACALTVLSRPEGIVVATAASGFHVVCAKLRGDPARAPIIGLVTSAACFAATLGLRWHVFDSLMPNGYYAKHSGAGALARGLGVVYLAKWARVHWIWLIIMVSGVVGAAREWRTRGWRTAIAPGFLFALTAFYFALVVEHGGDNDHAFPYWRHVVHVFPLVALLLGYAVAAAPSRLRGIAMTGGLASLILVDGMVLTARGGLGVQLVAGARNFPSPRNQPPSRYVRWLADHTTSTTVIASSFAGELPYVLDAVHIDMLGLNDRHIARFGHFDPAGPIDSKTDTAYVLSGRPAVIEGYVSGAAIVQGLPVDRIVLARKQMMHELLGDPIFRDEYLFVTNAPYDDLDRALFVHASFGRDHPDLAAVPVGRTSLYK
jgi:hypothetical protein